MSKLLLFFFLIIAVNMNAQVSAAGEYYLKGVMETASGFQLKEDGSFNFFFSYGAMDRGGTGKWKQEGDSIVFNSIEKNAKDFTVVKSSKRSQKGIIILINEPNEYFRKLIHAVIKSGKNEEQVAAKSDGMIVSKQTAADSISLIFEWCPDKVFTYPVPDKTHNYFEFKIEPTITDYIFNNFKLTINEEGLEGPHPLDPLKSFNYQKAKTTAE